MVPSVVKLAQAICSRDTPHHLQLIHVAADAHLCPENSTDTVFKLHSVSTINSALIFNGNMSVKKGTVMDQNASLFYSISCLHDV